MSRWCLAVLWLFFIIPVPSQANLEESLTCTSNLQNLEGNFPKGFINWWYLDVRKKHDLSGANHNPMLRPLQKSSSGFLSFTLIGPADRFAEVNDDFFSFKLEYTYASFPIPNVMGLRVEIASTDMFEQTPDSMEFCWKGSGKSQEHYLRFRNVKEDQENWLYVQIKTGTSNKGYPLFYVGIYPQIANGEFLKPNGDPTTEQVFAKFVSLTPRAPDYDSPTVDCAFHLPLSYSTQNRGNQFE